MRLEKTDGSLYNSRGIDHHLILVVRYLEVLKPPDATSRQNPHYDPAALHLRPPHIAGPPRPGVTGVGTR
jgi:hypothetical protein